MSTDVKQMDGTIDVPGQVAWSVDVGPVPTVQMNIDAAGGSRLYEVHGLKKLPRHQSPIFHSLSVKFSPAVRSGMQNFQQGHFGFRRHFCRVRAGGQQSCCAFAEIVGRS